MGMTLLYSFSSADRDPLGDCFWKIKTTECCVYSPAPWFLLPLQVRCQVWLRVPLRAHREAALQRLDLPGGIPSWASGHWAVEWCQVERGEQQPGRQELYSSVVALVCCKSYLAKSASGLSLLFSLLCSIEKVSQSLLLMMLKKQ